MKKIGVLGGSMSAAMLTAIASVGYEPMMVNKPSLPKVHKPIGNSNAKMGANGYQKKQRKRKQARRRK